LQKGKQKITLRESIAANTHIDQEVITHLMRLRDSGVDMYLACNESVDLPLLQKFADKNETQLDEALASNTNIDEGIFSSLLGKNEDVVKLLLWYQSIDEARYRLIQEKVTDKEVLAEIGSNRRLDKKVLEQLAEEDNTQLLVNLAANDTLDKYALDRIFERKIPETYPHLAINPATPVEILEILYADHAKESDILTALAYNPSTPVSILQALYEKDDFEITKGIASNPSVPLEILNILKIDTRLRNELTTNETFVASITQKLGL